MEQCGDARDAKALRCTIANPAIISSSRLHSGIRKGLHLADEVPRRTEMKRSISHPVFLGLLGFVLTAAPLALFG